MIDVVCFDLGGVIVRLRPSWEACCDAAGVAYEPDLVTEDVFRCDVNERHQRGEIDRVAYAEGIRDRLQGRLSTESILAAHAHWINGEYDGIADLVTRLRGAGRRAACLSNTCDAHWQVMLDYPALRDLDVRLASHELGLRKPDPAIFEAAQCALDVDPDAILFLDDTAENVVAARAAGWHASHIDPAVESTAPQIEALLRRHDVF